MSSLFVVHHICLCATVSTDRRDTFANLNDTFTYVSDITMSVYARVIGFFRCIFDIIKVVKQQYSFYVIILVSAGKEFLHRVHEWLYNWAILVYVLPQQSTFSAVCSLSIRVRRNSMRRHDYYAMFSNATLPIKLSVLCKHNKKKYISTSMLLAWHDSGHKLPTGLNLQWLFITHDLLTMSQFCRFLLCVSHCLFLIKNNVHLESPSCRGEKLNPKVHTMQINETSNRFSQFPLGGHSRSIFPSSVILPYLQNHDISIEETVFKYVDHVDASTLLNYDIKDFVGVHIPLYELSQHLPVSASRKVAHIHHIVIASHVPKRNLPLYFEHHDCVNCGLYTSVFSIAEAIKTKKCVRMQQKRATLSDEEVCRLRQRNSNARAKHRQDVDTQKVPGPEVVFPPPPLSLELSHTIISGFCNDSAPEKFEEAGCAVCGQLTPKINLSRLKSVKGLLKILEAPGTTRVERKHKNDHIREYTGPVLDYNCNQICEGCRRSIRKGVVPRLALANGLWLGNVPKELSELRFVEKLLIARIRHNCCFVRVASGLKKMTSHVIAFQSPTHRVYNELPPPIEELDEVLAILFTGPCKPTEEDLKRTPILVRRNHVAYALEWLKLNHPDYKDLEISHENLGKYPEDGPPVSIEYRHALTNKVPEGTSVFDNEIEEGTETGDCPFTVHGLYGGQLEENFKTSEVLKGIAYRYWEGGGGALRVGHSADPESIYKNPALYPSIFPWLFPYGLGGIGSTSLSDTAHKRYLLMYHDKRFQTDINFPFVAFSHEQVKASTTGGFILAKTDRFHDITNRLLQVNQEVLSELAKRMAEGEIVRPETQEQKDCFQLIRDLDYIGGKVNGSTTS